MEHESMVHALTEIHRVLRSPDPSSGKPGGILLDLRPVSENWSVEVVSSAGWESAGRLTDMPIGLADDSAAFHAMREAESLGLYSKIKDGDFDFFYTWDTPSEMKKYLDEEWADFENLEDDLYQRASAMWASANADARVRVRMKMWVAAWGKNG